MATKKKLAKSSEIKEKKALESERYIEPKKYVYACLILVGGILLALYIFSWYNVKQEEKYMNSYLISTNTVERTDLESLSQITQEAPSSYFIYLSYTGHENVYNLEKTLKRIIDKYKINDIFYYVDLTKEKEKANYLEDIKKDLELPKLDKIPAIIYVNDGLIQESNILTGNNNHLLQASELENLLENYEFEVVK